MKLFHCKRVCRKKRKWIVFIGCCLMCAVGFSVPNTVIAIFMQSLKETLHAPATSVMLYFTFYNIAAIPAAIFGQRVLKVNAAAVITVCAVICGLSLVLIGALPSIPILWSASVLIGLSAPLASILSVPIIIPNWFEDSGTPIGVAMAFVGVGTAIIVPVAQGVMDSALGWRTCIAGLGILYIIVIGVCGLFLVRYSSGGNLEKGKGTIRDKDCSQKKTKALGVLYQQLFKLPSFYLLMAVLIAIGFVGSFNTQNNIIIQNSGFGAAEAAYAVSSASIGLVIGKILLGFVSDRLTSVVSGFLAALFLLVGLSGMLFSFATASVPVLVVSMLVAGMGSCAGTIMAPLYTMDAFGPRDYGAIYATMSIGNNIGLIIASPVISMIFDTSGSYFGAMVLFMGTAVLFSLGGFLAVKSGRRVWNNERS